MSKEKVSKPKATKNKTVSAKKDAKPKQTKKNTNTAKKVVKPKVTKKKTEAVKKVDKSEPRKKNKPKSSVKKAKKSFLAELIENVEHGAKIVSEKTTEIATETFEKVKKGAVDAIDTSSHVVNELYYSASEYTDQFKDKIEMKKLNNSKQQLFAELGQFFYKKYKIENITFSKFSRSRNFTSILKNIQQLDEEIVELGNHLKK
jgi:hypothetical protein